MHRKTHQINYNITNSQQSEKFLRKQTKCSPINFDEFFEQLIVHRQLWTDFNKIEEDIIYMLNYVYNKYVASVEDLEKCRHIRIAIDCIIFNKLHDFLMPLIYNENEIEDRLFFEKSKELCKLNVTAEQFGAPENYAVPVLAAVVELASLDSHKSPLEKIHCLCTTYDLIFAELKIALIDIISKYSNSESDIPIINNSEVVPILMTVIVKAKLLHIYSNFYYMDTFIGSLKEYENVRGVLSNFKEAVSRLTVITKDLLKPGSKEVCKDLDLIKLIKLTTKYNTKRQNTTKRITPLEGHILRITDLIVSSTNEHNPIA